MFLPDLTKTHSLVYFGGSLMSLSAGSLFNPTQDGAGVMVLLIAGSGD